MGLWQRRRIAMRLALLAIGIVLGVGLYLRGVRIPSLLIMRPMVTLGMLLLVFGPVLIGLYFAGRSGRKG